MLKDIDDDDVQAADTCLYYEKPLHASLLTRTKAVNDGREVATI